MIRRLSLRLFSSASKAAPVSTQVPFSLPQPVSHTDYRIFISFLLCDSSSANSALIVYAGLIPSASNCSIFPQQTREDVYRSCELQLFSRSALASLRHIPLICFTFRLVTQLILMPDRISSQTTIVFSSMNNRNRFFAASFESISLIS